MPEAQWDSPFGAWDDSQTWDAGTAPNLGDVTPYLNRITSKHNQQPDYIAFLTGILQPLADALALAKGDLLTCFDLDTAVGVQLDQVGLWIGRTRQLAVPISNVYFTLDTGPGCDKGILRGPFDPKTQLLQLPDAQYRTLLYATVAANHWDGTIIGAHNAYAIIFGPGGFSLLIRDLGNMSMDLILGGPIPDAVTLALFTGGYLSLKPAGVRINRYIVSDNSNAPIFMLDAKPSQFVAGLDVGAFPTIYPGN